MKVEAQATRREEVEDVIRNNVHRRDKITQIGKLYDLAHQKGQLPVSSSPSPPLSRTTSATTSGASTPAVQKSDPFSTSASDTEKKDDADDNVKDPNRNPWNASCVIGLRVYSNHPDLGLKVVVPSKDDAHDVPTLDRDDVAKSALDEVQAVAEKVDEVVADAKDEEEDPEKPLKPLPAQIETKDRMESSRALVDSEDDEEDDEDEDDSGADD